MHRKQGHLILCRNLLCNFLFFPDILTIFGLIKCFIKKFYYSIWYYLWRNSQISTYGTTTSIALHMKGEPTISFSLPMENSSNKLNLTGMLSYGNTCQSMSAFGRLKKIHDTHLQRVTTIEDSDFARKKSIHKLSVDNHDKYVPPQMCIQMLGCVVYFCFFRLCFR